jgi:hypothetical protein
MQLHESAGTASNRAERDSDRPPSFDELLSAEAVTRTDQGCVRMFHLDANMRLKLVPLLEMTFPVVFDSWRARFDMEAVQSQGIWSFASYVDLEGEALPLAGGQPSELRAVLGAARPLAKGSQPGGIVLATEVVVFGHRSGGGTSHANTAGEGVERAGRLRVLYNLVRPFAAPGERVVEALPAQLESLTLRPSTPPPSAAELATTSEGYTPSEPPPAETRGSFAMHHTDANRIVYTGAYLNLAENHFADLVHAAGLPAASLHTRRARLSFKRAFVAGQAYALRGRLFINPDRKSTEGVVSFHAIDAAGASDDRPAVLVRFDANLG